MKNIVFVFMLLIFSGMANAQSVQCVKKNVAHKTSSEKLLNLYLSQKNNKYVHFQDSVDAHPFLILQLDCARFDEKTFFCADTIEGIYRYLIFKNNGTKAELGVYESNESGRIMGHYGTYLCESKPN